MGVQTCALPISIPRATRRADLAAPARMPYGASSSAAIHSSYVLDLLLGNQFGQQRIALPRGFQRHFPSGGELVILAGRTLLGIRDRLALPLGLNRSEEHT